MQPLATTPLPSDPIINTTVKPHTTNVDQLPHTGPRDTNYLLLGVIMSIMTYAALYTARRHAEVR